MATLLPPPKRQKIYHGVPEPPKQPDPSESKAPHVVVQFVSEDGGKALAPAVNLPADVSRAALEALVNKISAKADDDEPVPFAFHVVLPAAKGQESGLNAAPTRIPISTSLFEDVLSRPDEPYTAEDKLVVYCSPQSVFKVRPATRCSSTLSGHASPILCLSFSPTGSTMATGAGDACVRLWDLSTETPSHTLAGHRGWVLAVEWEGRGRTLASGGHDGQVRLWDPKSGKALGEAMRGHTKWVTSLAWEPVHLNPSSPRLASASKDNTVRIWSTAQRKCEITFGGHMAAVNAVLWGGGDESRRNAFIYTASSDRTVRIWDDKGKCHHILKDHAHWVTTIALSTDFVLRTGPFDHNAKMPKDDQEAQAWALKRFQTVTSISPEHLITGSDDHTMYLYSPFSASPSAFPKPTARLTGHQRPISHVAFSPDGTRIASGSWDGSVRLWIGRTGKFEATLRGHVGPVYRVCWSADGRMVVSASRDGTVKIWDLKTYKIKADLPGHTDEVYCVDFVADKIASGGRDKTVKIWKN